MPPYRSHALNGRPVQVELPFDVEELTQQHVRIIENTLVELVLSTN